jgi:hypothetical protein
MATAGQPGFERRCRAADAPMVGAVGPKRSRAAVGSALTCSLFASTRPARRNRDAVDGSVNSATPCATCGLSPAGRSR